MKGKLIVFEGTDCSGKETQSNLVVDYLNSKGVETVKMAFPNYNSPTGKIIAGAYLGKQGYMDPVFPEGASQVDTYVASMLFAMDRKYNINSLLFALEHGKNVVLDRYIVSNMAHQGSKLDNDEREKFFQFINKLEYELLKHPKVDLEIFLHMPTWASKQLKQNRLEKPDQHEADEEYLLKSENVYKEIYKKTPANIVECTIGDKIKSVQEINTEIKQILDNYFNL